MMVRQRAALRTETSGPPRFLMNRPTSHRFVASTTVVWKKPASTSRWPDRPRRWIGRISRLLVLVTLLAALPGCQIFHRFRDAGPTPTIFEQPPTQTQLLEHLKRQSESVRQIQADVRVSMDGVPSLRGTLAVERPNRVRLKAGLMGVNELGIDVGSNEEVFWFWARAAMPGQTNAIYYARHDQFRTSQMGRSIPLEPQWLVDALGLIEIGPDDSIQGPSIRRDGRWEFYWTRATATGPAQRVLVVNPQQGTVVQQAFYDQAGQLVAYINSLRHEFDKEHGVFLPRRMELFVPQPSGSPMKLVVDASDYRINSMYGDGSRLWSMPNPGDVPLVNLSEIGTEQTNGRLQMETAPGYADRTSYYLDDTRGTDLRYRR